MDGPYEQIVATLPTIQSLYHRLLFIGAQRSDLIESIAANGGWPLLNLGLVLSERLLDVPHRHRPANTSQIVAELLDETGAETLCVASIEILFAPELAQDPVRLLQGLSRNRTLIVAWPGSQEGTTLLYAESGHAEHYRQVVPDLVYIEASAGQRTGTQE